MSKRSWLWLLLPAAGTTALLVAVAVFAGDDDREPTNRAAATTTTTTSRTTRATTTSVPATTRREPKTATTTTARTTTAAPTTTSPTTTTTTTTTATEQPAAAASVPNVGGLTEDEALAELEDAGYRATIRRERSFQPDGTVFEQVPKPGTRLDAGATVRITVSRFRGRTPPPATPSGVPTATVPRVVGLPLERAGGQMQILGLIDDTYPVASGRRAGTVIAQTPTGGTQLRRGARVRLNVALGKAERSRVSVPATIELTDLLAHWRCRIAGLTCRTVLVVDGRPRLAGRVVRQWPRAGREVLVFTQMILYVAR